MRHDLVLQHARARRHDDAAAVEQRGHEVRERLAGARARLDEQHAVVGEGALNRVGHAQLRRALAVTLERLRQGPPRSKEFRRAHGRTVCRGARRLTPCNPVLRFPL